MGVYLGDDWVFDLIGQSRVWTCTFHPLFIHTHFLSVSLFMSIYYSFSFCPSLTARADSIRERGRWGENSVAGHYIWLDARKSFSVHHQAFLCPPPLFSFPLSVFTILPPAALSQITACVTLPLQPCVCMCVYMMCVYVCVVVCIYLWPDLVPCLRPCCDVAGHTYVSQPGREGEDEDKKKKEKRK